MAQLDPEVLPFVSQIIGAIFRVAGFGVNKHVDPEMKESRNSTVKEHLTNCFTSFTTKPQTKTIKFAEEGRIRFEDGNGQKVSVFLYLGDLKIKP
jgi:hypothetical protein